LYSFVYCLVILFTFSDMPDLRFFFFLDYLFEVFVSSIIIQYQDAIMKAMFKGTKRNVESEDDLKNTPAE
jgi:hypothetical protein